MADVPIPVRLKQLRDSAGLSVRQVADALGVSSSSYAFYESVPKFKKKALPIDKARQFAEVFAEYGVERSHVLALAGLDDSGALVPSGQDIAEQLDAVLLPEVDISYSMGGGFFNEDVPAVRMVPFSRSWLASLTTASPADLMVARGEGDSMMPTILDQDLVIIDRSQHTVRSQDRIWALGYGELGMIKRVRALPGGAYQINSDNAAVSPMIAVDGEMHVVGRVIAVIRRI